MGIFWNLWPEIKCGVALTKVFLKPITFVATAHKFVTNGWRTGQPPLTTLRMNGFIRNAKHGFNFWKWSNPAWSSSSWAPIYFSILPFRGPANASSRKAFVSFSLWHWNNDRMLLTMYVVEKIEFSSRNLSSLTWASDSVTRVTIFVDSDSSHVEKNGDSTRGSVSDSSQSQFYKISEFLIDKPTSCALKEMVYCFIWLSQ